MFRTASLAFSVLAFTLLGQGPAAAQEYPLAEPVKIIVPFSAGSSTDLLARAVAEELRKSTGGTFVVENRAGALGTIGAGMVARAKPDGYTLLLSSTATNSSPQFLFKSLPYDSLKGFEHVSRLALFQWMLVADPTLGYKSAKDLQAAGRANPGKLTYAYGSASSQVGGSALSKLLGIDALGVAYKAQPAALSDVAGNRISFMVVDVGVASPFVKTNKVQALAIANKKRSPLIPDVPTFEETGLPAFEFVGWAGLAAPAGTPDRVVQFLSQHVQTALASPDLVSKLSGMGIDAAPLPSRDFTQFVAEQYEFWGKRVADAGIPPQ
ncbi:MAG: Bug family tripartite tricarboxylate transporter substrate binding protein [Burkholderiaceae bacterium]